jgi:hypothetical protein
MSCVSREHSCPYTAQKFKIGIDQWLNNEPARWVGPIPMDKVGRLTFEAFVNQIDIGWDQAFRGRISKNWNRATREYHNERGLGEPQPQLQGSWSESVIRELWQIGTDCWIHRNEELYGKTEEEQLAKLMKEVDEKILADNKCLCTTRLRYQVTGSLYLLIHSLYARHLYLIWPSTYVV